jgi:hypothetical protein
MLYWFQVRLDMEYTGYYFTGKVETGPTCYGLQQVITYYYLKSVFALQF